MTSTRPDPCGRGSGKPPAGDSGPGRAVFTLRPLGLVVAALAGFREPIVAVLLAIAFFTAISGKPVDGVLLLLAAVSLAWDAGSRARKGSTAQPAGSDGHAGPAAATGDHAPPAAAAAAGSGQAAALGGQRRWAAGRSVASARQPGRRRGALALCAVVAGGAAYAAAVGTLRPYSWPATAAIIILGAVVVLIGWQGPLRQRPDQGPLPVAGAALWAGLFVAGCLWELAALLEQPSLTMTSYTHPTLSALTDPVLASAGGRSLVLAVWLAIGGYLVQR